MNTEEFMNLSMNDKVRTVNNILEKDYLDELKRLLHNHQNQLILAPLVYNPNSKTINKSFQVHADIYDRFSELYATQFPHLRQRDIISMSHLEY